MDIEHHSCFVWRGASLRSNSRILVLCLLILTLSSCTDERDGQAKGSQSYHSSLPTIKEAPLVHGTDAYSKDFSSNSLKGKVWLASFMFTSCQGVCPVMNANLQQLQSLADLKSVHFVSISVDPTTDTPEVLRQYAEHYAAQGDRWTFVTMPIDSVRKLSLKGFMLTDPVEPSAHSPRYALVDKANMIRGYYDSMDSSKVEQMRKDILDVLRE